MSVGLPRRFPDRDTVEVVRAEAEQLEPGEQDEERGDAQQDP